MIRAIGNTPAPVPTQTPAPVPEGGEQAGGQKLAFKGVLVRKLPKDLALGDFVDFVKAANPDAVISGGNKRGLKDPLNVFKLWFQEKTGCPLFLGRTADTEIDFMNNLRAAAVRNKEKFPEIAQCPQRCIVRVPDADEANLLAGKYGNR